MAWFILLIAAIFEVTWTIGLKYSQGFTKLVPTLITIPAMFLSMGLLSYAVRSLPVGTAYAVWTGIGVVGTVILGIILFNEPKDLLRIFFILLIVVGILGLKFFAK